MTPTELDTFAHRIAYSCTRSDIETMVTAVFVHPDGTEAPGGSIDRRWYDLSAKVASAFEREAIARAVHYLEARGLIQRHQQKPFLVRISDAPGEEVPVEGIRLVPM